MVTQAAARSPIRCISSDSQRVSRYENGRITPSVDAVVRIAEAFNVSIDYLLVEDAPRRPLHVADLGLASRLADIAELSARRCCTCSTPW